MITLLIVFADFYFAKRIVRRKRNTILLSNLNIHFTEDLSAPFNRWNE